MGLAMAHGAAAEPKTFLAILEGGRGLLKTPLGALIFLVASIFANYKIMEYQLAQAAERNVVIEKRVTEDEKEFVRRSDARDDKKEILDRLKEIYEAVQKTNERIDKLPRR